MIHFLCIGETNEDRIPTLRQDELIQGKQCLGLDDRTKHPQEQEIIYDTLEKSTNKFEEKG